MTTDVPTALPPSLAESQLINIKTVAAATGYGRSAIYERVREGTFPKPIRLGQRCTRWRVADVQAWLDQAVQSAKAAA